MSDDGTRDLVDFRNQTGTVSMCPWCRQLVRSDGGLSLPNRMGIYHRDCARTANEIDSLRREVDRLKLLLLGETP
jgi:hypothetical protein